MAEFPDNSWTRIVKLAGLEGGPHKARHTYASLFLRAKPDLFLLGRVLGHSHAKVTELYAHLLPEHLAEARGVVSFAPNVASEGSDAPRRTSGRGSARKAGRRSRTQGPKVEASAAAVQEEGVEG
jgi:phage tail tape-measure protein